VGDILSYALDDLGLSTDKPFMGAPFFCQEWIFTLSGGAFLVNEERTYGNVVEISDFFGSAPAWSDDVASPCLAYQRDVANQVIWFEDACSVTALLAVAQQRDVGALAGWPWAAKTLRFGPS